MEKAQGKLLIFLAFRKWFRGIEENDAHKGAFQLQNDENDLFFRNRSFRLKMSIVQCFKFGHYSYIFLFFLNLSHITATSISIAEGQPYAKEAKDCYVPLQILPNVSQLSRTAAEFADREIGQMAIDSTNARLGSLVCLRKFLKTKEDRESLAHSYENSIYREDQLNLLERKILLKQDRDYYLTPIEENLVTEYFLVRESLNSDIRRLTRSGILFDDKIWEKEGQNWQEEIKARYGALLREREKFLFSLSIESRSSYLTFLKQFTEK